MGIDEEAASTITPPHSPTLAQLCGRWLTCASWRCYTPTTSRTGQVLSVGITELYNTCIRR